MAGLICGFYGFQRSGKTLLAYLLSDFYSKQLGIKVYTNMSCSDFITISSLQDIPLDYKPKILLLDEAYYFLDSRSWKDNTDSSIFFNTIGKQNILLFLTAINPEMVDKRLREQHNYMFFVKGDNENIYYKLLDVQRNKSNYFTIAKNEKLFDRLKYDTLQVPDYVNTDFSFLKNKNKNKNIGGRL